MKTNNGTIILEDAVGFSPNLSEHSTFRDSTGTQFLIPNSLVIRIYEALKVTADRNNINFDDFCNNLFNKQD